jgi:Zn-dependent membrane protease YugP
MQLPKWVFLIYGCAGFVFFVVGILTKFITLWIVGIALMAFALILEGSLRKPAPPDTGSRERQGE